MDGAALQPAAAARDQRAGHVIVIGGGASGVLMAAHLLEAGEALRVTLIEKTRLLGCGLAYGTSDPNHLLNTRASNMSGLRRDPDHFVGWLRARGATAQGFSFVDRGTYGEYLRGLIEPWLCTDRLTCLHGEVLDLVERPESVGVTLADGRRVDGDSAVLAYGHLSPPAETGGPLSQPWSVAPPRDPEARVLIIGSGLTMVDQTVSLLARGHRGPIIAVSRRGLLPQVHADSAALGITTPEVPFGASAGQLTRWLRARIRSHQAGGGDWRAVVDGLRPHVQPLWQAMGHEDRARFIRHACVWWETHRHRMPPQSAALMTMARQDGQLRLMRAAYLGAEQVGEDIEVRLRPQDGGEDQQIRVGLAIDCRGIRRDPETHAGPLLRALLDRGAAVIEPLRLGVAVDHAARLIAADGRPSTRIRAVGPVSRAAFWEITAIPDIREQCAQIAQELAETV